MYCPRCGQQQISDEMRFCSRCGLLMSGLAEWLAAGGPLAGKPQETHVAMTSPRRKGIRRGAKVMFFSVVLFLIFLMLAIAVDEPGPLVIPFITFIVGLTITLYSRLFGDQYPAIRNTAPEQMGSPVMPATQLPPASSIPIYTAPHVRTNELVQPPSVTENTTKLLDQE
jgi:hypothetical protein